MDEILILVDSADHRIGSATKLDCHSSKGLLHRAFSVLLFNESGLLLVQRRALTKITFPGVWANSCCSHPLDNDRERIEEDDLGVRRAAVRRLEHELGIVGSVLSEGLVRPVGRFEYEARMSEEWAEHELVHVLFVRTNLEIDPNPNEIAETRWVGPDQLNSMATAHARTDLVIAPWFELIRTHYLARLWITNKGPEAINDTLIRHF